MAGKTPVMKGAKKTGRMAPSTDINAMGAAAFDETLQQMTTEMDTQPKGKGEAPAEGQG